MFDGVEVERGDRVAVINEAAAKLWPTGQDPVGSRLRLDLLATPPPRTLIDTSRGAEVTIVGVIADTRNEGVRAETKPSVVLPYSILGVPQAPGGFNRYRLCRRFQSHDAEELFGAPQHAGAEIEIPNADAGRHFRHREHLVAFAKSHPGKVTYASAGAGSTIHLASEFFRRQAGIEILHVPYKGAAPAMTDPLGGQVDMMFAPAVASLPLAAAGKLKALAVTSARRSALAPELPTVAESGLPGFEVSGWYGLAAPAATPAAAVTRLNAETNRALQSDGVIAELRSQGLEPAGDTTAAATAWIGAEVARWTTIIRDAGIKPQ